MTWLEHEVTTLPESVEFVIVTLHHPPVADIQTPLQVDHNPRPSEAGRQIDRALEDAPDRVMVRFTSALVFELTGQRQAALDALKSAIDGGHPSTRLLTTRTFGASVRMSATCSWSGALAGSGDLTMEAPKRAPRRSATLQRVALTQRKDIR